MKSLQRVVAAVRFQEVDRVPVIPQVFGHAATLTGVPLDRYVREGKTLAHCQLSAMKRYGYDAVFSLMDANVEAEALGCSLAYRSHRYPVIERHAAWASSSQALALPDFDPQRSGRMPEMLTALDILRNHLGDDALVVGCVLGPFTLVSQLLGLEPTLFLFVDDPARLEQLMDLATEAIIRFGHAQLRAGAHLPLVFEPAGSPAVLTARLFSQFVAPRLKRIFSSFSGAGATANWLHIAGPVAPILPLYPELGVDIANIDYCVKLDLLSQVPALCVDGNIKSFSFVDGTPAEITADAQQLLSRLEARKGFILSSGCEIPPEARPENIEAMVSAAQRFRENRN